MASTSLASSDPLADAILEFQGILTPSQQSELLTQCQKPDATAILTFTAEVDRVNAHRRSRCVSSRLFGILQSVQDFTTIVDTFVSARPEIAALVWGAIKLTILFANNVVSFFDKLSECFLRVGKYCPRYTEYQSLFGDSLRLQKSLCSFYATVVNFCARAIQTIERPGPTLVKAMWRPFEKEFGAFEEKLQEQNEDVKEEIRLAGAQAAAREREAAAKHRDSGSIFRTGEKQLGKETQERRLRKDLQRAKAKRENLLEKLSSYDYAGALRRIRKKRHGNTSSWLSKSATFRHWFEEDGSCVLWLSGILGSGKSVVTAFAIDEILCRRRKDKDRIGFFFCQFDNSESLEAWTILATLTLQCLSAEALPDTIESRLTTLFENRSPDPEDLEPLLRDIAAISGTITFIIDGFDECARGQRLIVLDILQRLISSSRSIKIFLSSRDDVIADIARRFSTCHQAYMDCDEARSDIQSYVNVAVEQRLESGELVIGNSQLIDDIQKSLIRGANGMFLWVSFQIDDLCHQKCDADIRKSLAGLPKDMPETYERILTRVLQEGNTNIVNRILRWAAAVKRPLQLEELREAISIEPQDIYLPKDRLVNDVDGIISWCHSLIRVDEEDLQVQFAHHSVKQFLLTNAGAESTKQFHFEDFEVDHMAGEICVTYLNFNDFKQQMIQSPKTPRIIQPEDLISSTTTPVQNLIARYSLQLARKVSRRPRSNFDLLRQLEHTSGKDVIDVKQDSFQTYAFLAYASEFWLTHTSGFRPGYSLTWALWKQLVLTSDYPLASKPWRIDREGHVDLRGKQAFINKVIDDRHLALIACVRETLKFGNSMIPVEDLLVVACFKGNTQVVNFILDFDYSAVEIADGKGFDTQKDKLLRSYVEISLPRSKSNRTALQAASGAGHLEIVDILLLAGADVNAEPGSQGCTALEAAAWRGHLGVVGRLLSAGADVNDPLPQYWKGRAALLAAARGGHLEVVKMLLSAGADANAIQPAFRCTALQAAARRGHLDVVEALLSAHADVNAILPEYSVDRTALQAAVEGGHLDVVDRLLLAKAEVNLSCDAEKRAGNSALHIAATVGNLKMVEKLLLAGADVNLRLPWTALDIAVKYGHFEVAKRLLVAGSDHCSPSYTILAKEKGYSEVVKLVQDAGVVKPYYREIGDRPLWPPFPSETE